jgi:hypothetical protein
VVDLLVAGAAAEQDADDALTALALARLLGERLRVGLRVDALDLPDVDLDAVVLDLLDRAPHQLRTQLGVVAVAVAVDGGQLRLGRGHEKLVEELAVVGVQPVGEALEALVLALVEGRVVVRVVTDEDLAEGRVERLDVAAEVVPVLEVELVLAALLDRHRELEALRLRLARDVAAELLVHEHAERAVVGAAIGRERHALVDQLLGVGDRGGLLGRRITLDPEHLLLEGAAVVEREDVEPAVVSESHETVL